MDIDLDYEPTTKFAPGTKPKESRSSYLRIPGHLRDPITSTECRFLLEHYKNKYISCARHRGVVKYMKQLDSVKYIYDTCDSPWKCLINYFRNKAQHQGKRLSKTLSRQLETLINSSLCNWTNQKELYDSSDDLKPNFRNPEISNLISDSIKNDDDIMRSYYDKILSESIKELVTEKEFKAGDFLEIYDDLIVEKEVFLFRCKNHNNQVVIGPTSLLLGVLDILQTRFGLFVYWKLSDLFVKYRSEINGKPISIFEHGMKLVKFFESILDEYGEDIFKVLKSWDSYVIGKTCSLQDRGDNFISLARETSKEIKNILKRGHWKKLRSLWFSTSRCNEDTAWIFIYHELTGLCKAFGHPCIDPREGMMEVREEAGKRINVNPLMRQKVRAMFIKTFCTNYYSKHKKWPNVSFDISPNMTIFSCYVKSLWPSESQLSQIPLLDWGLLTFEKTLDYDMILDTADIISDKAASPRRQNWSQGYCSCGFKILYGKPKPRIGKYDITRLVLRYLKGNRHETFEEVMRVINNDPKLENDIVMLCVKERELKKKRKNVL